MKYSIIFPAGLALVTTSYAQDSEDFDALIVTRDAEAKLGGGFHLPSVSNLAGHANTGANLAQQGINLVSQVPSLISSFKNAKAKRDLEYDVNTLLEARDAEARFGGGGFHVPSFSHVADHVSTGSNLAQQGINLVGQVPDLISSFKNAKAKRDLGGDDILMARAAEAKGGSFRGPSLSQVAHHANTGANLAQQGINLANQVPDLINKFKATKGKRDLADDATLLVTRDEFLADVAEFLVARDPEPRRSKKSRKSHKHRKHKHHKHKTHKHKPKPQSSQSSDSPDQAAQAAQPAAPGSQTPDQTSPQAVPQAPLTQRDLGVDDTEGIVLMARDAEKSALSTQSGDGSSKNSVPNATNAKARATTTGGTPSPTTPTRPKPNRLSKLNSSSKLDSSSKHDKLSKPGDSSKPSSKSPMRPSSKGPNSNPLMKSSKPSGKTPEIIEIDPIINMGGGGGNSAVVTRDLGADSEQMLMARDALVADLDDDVFDLLARNAEAWGFDDEELDTLFTRDAQTDPDAWIDGVDDDLAALLTHHAAFGSRRGRGRAFGSGQA